MATSQPVLPPSSICQLCPRNRGLNSYTHCCTSTVRIVSGYLHRGARARTQQLERGKWDLSSPPRNRTLTPPLEDPHSRELGMPRESSLTNETEEEVIGGDPKGLIF
ncbi:hypothetical protein CapIbe_004644 [Capra ibex]